ncbi:polysaccharide pyruvyl transferase family protein [Cellulomonas sp. URHD0024]|uniref:polysaccharide pyruvyl transferase family protein n=1 Tax=Cellulomonas sp. URHD0024 TaxID=1302620 RepID=UPI00040B0531|nr:polysaccharide pyruvyl transferase family protein [Cellulomonas sp. URHD0024]
MTRVLVSAEGQVDNIGDSVLRRGLLDALRPLGELVVGLRGSTPDYASGLGLHDSDEVVSSSGEWRSLVASQTRRGCGFAYNAGEAQLTRGWGVTYARLAPLLVLNRLRGGHAVHLGFGLRSEDRFWARVMRLSLAPCELVTWRDAASRDWVGTGTVAPDWAYAAGPAAPDGVAELPTSGRDVLAVSLRFDRPAPSAAWLKTVRAVADDRGLRIVAIAQVERDRPRAADLARLLDGDLVDWTGTAHADVEVQVRSVYRRSALVVSDRLHAVVMGHTEGAVPVGLGTDSVAKLDRTLSAVGVTGAAFVAGDDVAGDISRVHDLLERRAEVLGCADTAGSRLAAVRGRLLDLFAR